MAAYTLVVLAKRGVPAELGHVFLAAAFGFACGGVGLRALCLGEGPTIIGASANLEARPYGGGGAVSGKPTTDNEAILAAVV